MDALAAFAVLAILVQKIIEHVRKAVPQLDGVGVTILAAVVGYGIAAGTGLHVLDQLVPGVTVAVWLDYAITGFALGAGAGFFADVTNRSGEASTSGTSGSGSV